MKKVLDFLEANVQWVALGLGVLWVLWMAWTYAINKPVAVKVGNEEMAPGSVDPYIVEHAVNDLRGKMERSGPVPNIPSPKWAQAFRDGMANKGEQVATLEPMIGLDMVALSGPGGTGGPNNEYRDQPVVKLPTPPPAVMMEARSGMSNVTVPQQLAAASGNGNGNGADAAAGVEVQPVALNGKDIVWITSLYRIPMTELAASFRDVKIPPDQYNTSVLEIKLEREEQLPDGSWGKLTTIRPLPTVQLRPMPSDAARVKEKTDHLQWAIANVVQIVQPPFYQVLRGDEWAAPGQAVQPVVAEAPKDTTEKFDPSKYVDAPLAELMKLTPEQRRQVAEYKKKKEDEDRKNRSKDRGGKGTGGKGGMGGMGGGGLGGGGRGGGGFGPNDGDRTGGGFQDPGAGGDPASGQRGQREDSPPPMPTPGVGNEGQLQGQPQPEAPAAGGQYPAPPGEFDPSKSQGQDIIGWAHDDTCEAGKTYRYRVTYKIKSPVWNTQNMTKPQELANVFCVESDKNKTEWGQPVKVESLSHFWVVRPSFKGESAQVQVFRFSGGQLRTKVFDVAPGDAVGLPDGDVDYGTGWTMVDMPTDARGDRYVLLMDPHGRLQTRDFRADQADPKYKEMLQQANAAAAATGAGGDAVAGTR